MEFNKKGFDSFRVDIEKAIEDVAKKHNVKVTTGKIKYGEYDFNMDLKVVKTDLGIDVEQEQFNNYCELFGFAKTDYKREFTLQGDKYILSGFNLNSPKNDCSIVCLSSGKKYKTNSETVKRAFAI